MLKCPQFKPHLQVQVRNGEGVFILSEMNQTVLQGSFYEAVVPLLDGRSVEEVCQQLVGTLQPAHVFYTLNKLEEQGVLCERPQAGGTAHSALWALQGVDPSVALDRLERTSVAVTSLGIDPAPLAQLLESLGVSLSSDGPLQVVVTDHYLRPELAEINRRALAAGTSWILVKPVGAVIWLGPLFRPRTTGCWECLANRIRANFPVLGYLDNAPNGQPLPGIEQAHTAATMAAAWGLAANQIASAIVSESSAALLEGRLQTFNTLTWQTESHLLLKQPACKACGNPQAHHEKLASLSPLELRSCRKTFTADGGHRALSPQETLDRYGHHVSSICGAVSQLQKCAPSSDGVMHVYVSGNNAARAPQNLMSLKSDLRHNSAGKGTSDVQAKASALCEALERYSGIFQGDEPRLSASFEELGEDAIHPNACMLYSQRQFQERDLRNLNCSVYNFIPQPLDPTRPIQWSPVWSLTRQQMRYLPTAFCYFHVPQDADATYCMGCSNGNAAGNSLEEAVFQGFLELAER
ncbi:MAG: TOMM precursor leader peptide-binding protein, partial [Aureliella sp.]